MTQWDYRALIIGRGEAVTALRCEGEAGWEAFGVEPAPGFPDTTTFWLKRPRADAAPRGLRGRLQAAGYREG